MVQDVQMSSLTRDADMWDAPLLPVITTTKDQLGGNEVDKSDEREVEDLRKAWFDGGRVTPLIETLIHLEAKGPGIDKRTNFREKSEGLQSFHGRIPFMG